jgi:hypothetical protein
MKKLLLSIIFILITSAAIAGVVLDNSVWGQGTFNLIGTDLRSACIGAWNFNEASWSGAAGEILDSSGLSQNGVRLGDATTTSSGILSNAGTFDGTGDAADFSSSYGNFGTGDFSIAGWIKTTDTSENKFWLSKSLAAAQNYRYGMRIGATTGYPAFFIQGNGGSDVLVEGSTTVCDGNWHFIVGTADRNGNAQLFVDSVYKNQASISSWDGLNFTSINPLRIGSYTNADNTSVMLSWNGQIDAVRLFNRILTQDEINFLYNSGAGTESLYSN